MRTTEEIADRINQLIIEMRGDKREVEEITDSDLAQRRMTFGVYAGLLWVLEMEDKLTEGEDGYSWPTEV